MKIALLEDDRYQGQLMQLWLDSAGHDCQLFESGEALVDSAQNTDFDLYILDWVLPGMSGDEVLTWVREAKGWEVPIIFVTQKDSQDDIVSALRGGADDYMIKPVQQAEMLARLEAIGRRMARQQPSIKRIDCGQYSLDLETRTLLRAGQAISLTQKEFDLAAHLFTHIGQIAERLDIMQSVWGTKAELKTRTVDIHISRLRKKLGLNGEYGLRLSGIYNHGYRLEKVLANEDKSA